MKNWTGEPKLPPRTRWQEENEKTQAEVQAALVIALANQDTKAVGDYVERHGNWR